MQWHQITAAEALHRLGTSARQGLRREQVKQHQKQYGPNRLQEEKSSGALRRFFGQFNDFMVLILLAAAAVSFGTAMLEPGGDFMDPVIILLIVVTDAVIGTIQEGKAEKAIAALQKLSAPVSRVRRNGTLQEIPSEEITVGDLVQLQEGDCVPADGRLVESTGLQMDEAALTGESFPVQKDCRLQLPEKAPVSERQNMVFAGTSVAAGHGWAVMTEVGMQTEMGRIAALLTHGAPPKTPLQQRLAKTGKVLGLAAIAICGLIFVLGLLQQIPVLEMFMIAVSLAVAAIPEGLPAVVTIVLALGVRRIAAQRAIVRRLPAVETLGCATVICSDKTGTLTQNRMTVVQLSDGLRPLNLEEEPARQLLEWGMLCCNAVQQPGGRAEGDPTETAIVRQGGALGVNQQELCRRFPRTGEIPFDSSEKYMVTCHRAENGYLIAVKGAPEVILRMCSRYGAEQPMSAGQEAQIRGQLQQMSRQALRVLAVAVRRTPEMPEQGQWTQNLCFAGLIGLMDPPRPEVQAAVQQCRRAGIRPVMITGDHVLTAEAVARMLGIRQQGDITITGPELDELNDDRLAEAASRCSVYARVTPSHKVRIVQALQRRGHVVAMTGDGVNDAPALRAADIGCAMGRSGTEVARSAADMVLTDDCFSTIVAAVAQGRSIYANIQKAVHFLLSCNIGEIATVLGAFLLRLPAPLLAIQLLWVNLVTDALPALALGMEPMERDVMEQPPIHRNQSLFAGGLWYKILLEGLLIGSMSLLAFVLGRCFFDENPACPVVGRTMAFAVLSFSQLVHAFNMRSSRSLFRIGVCSNRKMIGAFLVGAALQISVIVLPVLNSVFETSRLAGGPAWITVLLSLTPLAVCELEKGFRAEKNE